MCYYPYPALGACPSCGRCRDCGGGGYFGAPYHQPYRQPYTVTTGKDIQIDWSNRDELAQFLENQRKAKPSASL